MVLLVDGRWRSVGTFSDVSAWSFCQDKIISTAGEGGMVTTNNSPELFDKIWSFKDHGKSRDAVLNRHHPPGFRWLHDGFGSNFRLTEIQSAVGRVQLNYIYEWNQIRSRNAQILTDYLSVCSNVRVPVIPEYIRHAWYKFHCYVIPESLSDGWSEDRISSEISALNFPCRHGSCSEIYLEVFSGCRPYSHSDFQLLENLVILV